MTPFDWGQIRLRAALAGLSGLLFVGLSLLVAAYHPRRFDLETAAWLHAHGFVALDYLNSFVSVLGNAEITLILGFAAGLELLRRRRPREALTFLILPLSVILELIVKNSIVDPPPLATFRRGQGLLPPVLAGIDIHTPGSFPSGHALRAVVLYGLLAWLVLRFGPRQRRWLVSIPLLLAVLISVSRVYLADHWLSDVLGAAALGLCLVLAATTAVRAGDGRAT